MRVPFLVAIILLACSSQKPATSAASHFGSKADPLFFSLERTPCFGRCPAYTVTIQADGSARYVGRTNAPRQGTFSGQVDIGTMQRLLDRANSIGFFSMDAKYDGQVTDLPSTIVRVNADGKDKQVTGRYRMPAAFRGFAAFADTLLQDVQWKPVPGADR